MDAWTKAAGSHLGANTRARPPMPEGVHARPCAVWERGDEAGGVGLSAGAGEWGGEGPKGVYEGCMPERACEQLAFAHLNLLTFPLATPADRLHGKGLPLVLGHIRVS